MGNLILRAYTRILNFIQCPRKKKAKYELEYWENREETEGSLSHRHYEYFYTTHFSIDKSFFNGKKILDIGCGPRGSLEWADKASERVGLDPLIPSYRKLGIDAHKMKYVNALAERIPFSDGYFDIVSSFNSLDYVDNLDQTVKEIIRVIAPGGLFLLLVNVNHAPTVTEPIVFSWDVIEKFTPYLELIEEKHYEKSAGGIYESIRVNIPFDHSNKSKRHGVLSAKFIKRQEGIYQKHNEE